MDVEQIGNTELIELTNISSNGNRLFVKCEYKNPTGSHKDRTFLHIIESLELHGKISPGMTLIDCSTGNGGAALAWIGQQKGYNVVIFMPEGMTRERIQQIKSFGAEIIETPKEKFLNGSDDEAIAYAKVNKNSFYINQSENILNMESWYECGREIIKQLASKNINPDYFICSIGTGGTFSGISKILKEEFPKLKSIGIEVDKSSPIHAKINKKIFTHRPHNMMGLGAGKISGNTKIDPIDEIKVISGEHAWARMRRFIKTNNKEIGPTCGANILISKEIMRSVSNKVIITIFFDSSWKYKSRWNGIYPEYNM
ncbi:cysteine synthase family protein [Edwardsiella ictaluri]|uniref:cysteine synthase family protein n=1 Tax=Edwardsiella ictaluri TaxID=67780 RepID=UPI003784FC45